MAHTSMTVSIESPHAEESPQPRSSGRWRHLFFGGNLLYVASAACILIGIGQIIIPAFKRDELASASVQGWATLNVYELALLAATLLLVLWRRVLDDAISLTLLVAIFIVGTAITLDTVGPAWPGTAMALGGAGLLLAAGKLAALRRWVVAGPGGWAGAGLAVLLLWNFIMPGYLGWRIEREALDEQIRPLFLMGWCVTLAGGMLVLIGAARLPGMARKSNAVPLDPAASPAAATPFVRTANMTWLCLLAMLAGTFAHQYALNYVTLTRSLPWGDFLPAFGLLVLVQLEVNRAKRWGPGWMAGLLSLLPLAAAGVVMLTGSHQSKWELDVAVVNYPPVFLLAMGILLGVLSLARRRMFMFVVAGMYGFIGAGFLYRDIATANPGSSGWLWIVAAFALLGMGFAVSMQKGAARPQVVGQ